MELARRQGKSPAFLNIGFDLAANALVQIGRGQRNGAVSRFDEHVFQYGHGGLLDSNHVENLGQAIGQMITVYFKLHGNDFDIFPEKLNRKSIRV